jgi:hypothetical protein
VAVIQNGWFFRVRVTLLSLLLAVVCLWACHDVRARRARNEWQVPVRVGLVLLRHGAVDEQALLALQSRIPALEQRLAAEFQRYQPELSTRMIELVPYGPVTVSEPPPSDPGTSLWSRALHAYGLWRYTRAVDDRAGVPTHDLDSRIYVVVDPARGSANFVEGFGEARGRVGVARIDLNAETIDLALIVAAHELFHTLGASDKYDEDGRTSFPYGLPEPDQVPRFPQRYAEIMARNRVLSATSEVPPDSLAELRVGRWTAEEIGWAR